jgi:hypothetical protein
LSLKRRVRSDGNMQQLLFIFVILAFVFYPKGSASASNRVSLGGYFKNYFTALDRPEPEGLAETQPIIGAVNNRLRLKLFGKISPPISLTLAYDVSPRVQDRSLFEEQTLDLGFSPQTYRAGDIESRLYPDKDDPVSSFAIFQNLDRAHLTIDAELADIYLGRQAIAWGSARVINPTDILAPYAFNELDVEDRMGVDAVRVRVPMGFMGEMDLGCVFGDDFKFENSAAFLRSKFYYRRTDISLLTVAFRENFLAGFDLTRPVGGAGFWLEGGYVLVGALDSDERDQNQDYFRASLGADYALWSGSYLFAEYHFNEAGASQADDYLNRFEKSAYAEGSVYLLGKHYLAPGLSCQITPLLLLNGQALVNLTDPSVFLMPQVEYNFSEDVYLSAGAYLGLGESPEYLADYGYGPFLRLRSEFGGYPDFYFTSFRVYF